MEAGEDTKPALAALLATIRKTSTIAAQDIGFYTSLDKTLAKSASETSGKLLDVVNQILNVVSPGEVDDLTEADDVERNWKDISGVVDALLEKTDISLDSLNRRNKPASAAAISTTAEPQELKGVAGAKDDKVIHHSRTLVKPQLQFKRPIDNSRDLPFKPLLTVKPHAIVPLEESITFTIGGEDDETESHYVQPYATEISEQPYPELSVSEPIPYKDWDSTTAVYVDSVEKLNAMLAELEKSTEIAVDLEHHDYRSFYGIVCLMQISNREHDWVVDTLVLRDELQVLNSVFANPNIVKVLHGAFMDIMWLQRDFGLYVVGLFDTFNASKALGFPRLGLAYLLETYAKFLTSKKYQLADWRLRPLPAQMLEYARADTHFLLYIYDILRNRLIEENKLENVLQSSRSVAAQRYENPGYSAATSEGWRPITLKYRLSPNQQIVLRDLYEWRDNAARSADESPRYIAANHFLVALSFGMPTTVTEVLSISNGVTAHVRSAAKTIAKIIENCKVRIETSTEEPEAEEAAVEEVKEAVELNYDEYQENYQKALEWQKPLFAWDNVGTVLSTLRLQSSALSGLGEPVSVAVDSQLYAERADQVRANLDLQVPTLVDSEESEESDVEEEASEIPLPETAESAEAELTGVEEPEEEADELIESAGSGAKRKSDEALGSRSKRKKRRKLKLVSKGDVENNDKYDPSAESEPVVPSLPDLALDVFDYKKAEPVLEQDNKKKKPAPKDKKKRSFDPYGNLSEDRPKGPRKFNRPTGGRTGTFKR